MMRLFVYGPLLRGEPNHALLAHCERVGGVRTEVGYELVDLGAYPAMRRRGCHRVVGEVYLVDQRTLASVDRLEGHPDYYCRQRVRLDDGSSAWAYLLDAAQGDVVAGGDWRRR